ncbi:hypothetical protein [Piscirickettsia salmonis]|uniref:hypothetical protein n=1 Tax=Piscirickettsia salmonis TaxID=1238 RepID=UPI000332CE85|nr:hypothetical protein [Piscirickettsia salmonis]ERL60708.1 hypothetical protein K661_02978 [Piscirickettsia salmonis LF-89 = ATCC VR-1361]
MLQTSGLSQFRSAKNPHLPRPTHPVPCTPWLAALARPYPSRPRSGPILVVKKSNCDRSRQDHI